MEPIQYLRALRQRWRVILLAAIIGAVAGYGTATSKSASAATQETLLFQPETAAVAGDTGGPPPDPSTTVARYGFLMTHGEVPRRVAQKVGGDPVDLVKRVKLAVNGALGTISLEVADPNAGRSRQLADAFATQLIAYLDQQEAATREQAIRSLTTQRDDLTASITELTRRIGAQPNPTQNDLDTATRGGLITTYGHVDERLRALQTAGPAKSGLTVLDRNDNVQAGGPPSRTKRAAIGGVVGLLLGMGLALFLARFDTRIRTKDEAEAAFGLPVLAEVPLIGRRRRGHHRILTVSEPESLVAETHRALRTALLLTPMSGNGSGRGRRTRESDAHYEERRASRVILVVSPGMGEGKTTTVANLAAGFAETGRSVLVLAADLRRPEIHRYFDAPEEPGMVDVLEHSPSAPTLGSVVHETSVPNVRIVPVGEPSEKPGELLTRGTTIIAQSRSLADVVIIDTPPVLATDDASALVPIADDVLIVCRAGRTTLDGAHRCLELLKRLRAPIRGVTLIGAPKIPTASTYYRTDPRSRKRRQGGAPAPDSTDAFASRGIGESASPGDADRAAPDPAQAGGARADRHDGARESATDAGGDDSAWAGPTGG